ncbi:MAG: hypothetical protein JSR11_03835 [Bacteroidetes bacterium]|jgi:hypothetical protein|nr:hypothetical protein [Bacteroidota bacterium]
MSKGILWTIKIVVILVVLVFMTAAKEIGIPIIVKNIIGFGIIYAVWKYKPDEPNDNTNNQELDKS